MGSLDKHLKFLRNYSKVNGIIFHMKKNGSLSVETVEVVSE